MRRYRAWRNRLRSEAVALGGHRFRITRQRGKVVGIEMWSPPTEDGAYPYTVWKGLIQ